MTNNIFLLIWVAMLVFPNPFNLILAPVAFGTQLVLNRREIAAIYNRT